MEGFVETHIYRIYLSLPIISVWVSPRLILLGSIVGLTNSASILASISFYNLRLFSDTCYAHAPRLIMGNSCCQSVYLTDRYSYEQTQNMQNTGLAI